MEFFIIPILATYFYRMEIFHTIVTHHASKHLHFLGMVSCMVLTK
jgi:hypothetical protein